MFNALTRFSLGHDSQYSEGYDEDHQQTKSPRQINRTETINQDPRALGSENLSTQGTKKVTITKEQQTRHKEGPEWIVRSNKIYRRRPGDLEVSKPFRVNNRKKGVKRGKYTVVSEEVKNKLTRLVLINNKTILEAT